MMMPGMHGVDVLKVLRSMNPDLPVIMITGTLSPSEGDGGSPRRKHPKSSSRCSPTRC